MHTVPSKPNPNEQDRRGAATLAVMSTIWGSSFLLVTLSLRLFEPAQVASSRLLIGGGFLAIIVLLSRHSFRGLFSHWHWLLVVSLFNYAIPFYLMAWAQQTVSSSTTAMFMSGIPLYTLVLSRLVLGQSVSVKRWFGFSVGCIGLIALALANGASASIGVDTNLPYGALVLAGFMLACGSILVRRMPTMPSLPATSVLLVVAGLLLFPFGSTDTWQTGFAAATNEFTSPTFIALAALLFLAFVPTGLGQFMRTFTIQRYGPVFYSLVGYLVLPMTAALRCHQSSRHSRPNLVFRFARIAKSLLAFSHQGLTA